MDQIITPEKLYAEAEALASGAKIVDPADLLEDSISFLRPAERISTTECAERYRYVRNAEGSGKTKWKLARTPYLKGPQDALDDPEVEEVIIPKPGRTGGTVALENYMFKVMRQGPMTDVLWYLGSGEEVKKYCRDDVERLFEFHSELAEKLGTGRSDNNLDFKKVSGRTIEYLPGTPSKFTQRQAGLMVFDEIDAWTNKAMRDSAIQQARIRARMLGSRRKLGVASHPDAGWTSGVANAWEQSSRGIYIWPCVECGLWSSPWPTKFHEDFPHSEIIWDRDERAPHDIRIEMAKETAFLLCPHCGSPLNDKQRKEMSGLGDWYHKGQEFDPETGSHGEPTNKKYMGFWIHGSMVTVTDAGELASSHEAAKIKFETTNKIARFKEVVCKEFGEVFEGEGLIAKGLNKRRLKKRIQDTAEIEDQVDDIVPYESGEVPKWVLYLTAAVDVGVNKFDIGVKGWGSDAESCWIDRYTLLTDEDGKSIKPPTTQDDWEVLIPHIFDKIYPIMGKKKMGLKIASVGIDTGGAPGTTSKAREFVRRMKLAGYGGVNQYKIRLLKGANTKTAAEIGPPREINKDDENNKLEPPVTEFTIGVHKIKKTVAYRLGEDTVGPGYVHFPTDFQDQWLTEITCAKLVEDTWEETRPNETWDLEVYNEFVRQQLGPDRKEINWKTVSKRPSWARPVPIRKGDVKSKKPKRKSILDRFSELNSEEH